MTQSGVLPIPAVKRAPGCGIARHTLIQNLMIWRRASGDASPGPQGVKNSIGIYLPNTIAHSCWAMRDPDLKHHRDT